MVLPVLFHAVNFLYNRYRRQKFEQLSQELILINIKRPGDISFAKSKDDQVSVKSSTDGAELKPLDRHTEAVPLSTRLVLTVFYTFGVTINYLLMCVVMTMNVYLLLSLLIGFGLGYFAFNYERVQLLNA